MITKDRASGLAGTTRPAAPATAGQGPGELLAPSLAGADEPVDRLVAQPLSGRGLDAPPPGDRLGRAAITEPIHDRVARPGVPLELGARPAPSHHEVLRRRRPVALGLRHLAVVPPVAPDPAVDRRAVTAERGGDLGDRDLRLAPAMEPPALIEVEVDGRRGPGGLRATHRPCPPVALRNRVRPRLHSCGNNAKTSPSLPSGSGTGR